MWVLSRICGIAGTRFAQIPCRMRIQKDVASLLPRVLTVSLLASLSRSQSRTLLQSGRRQYTQHRTFWHGPETTYKAVAGVCPLPRQVATSASVKADNSQGQTELNYEEMISCINNKQSALIIDVRQREEVADTGMMPGAVNVPLDELESALGLADDEFSRRYRVGKPQWPGADIIFSCRRGRRSRAALEMAHKAGYTKSKHYIGGWDEYYSKRS